MRRRAVVVATWFAAGCAGAPAVPAGPSEPEEITFAAELGVDLSAMQRTPTGLYVRDLKEGDGFTARRTSLVTLRYVGTCPTGPSSIPPATESPSSSGSAATRSSGGGTRGSQA